MGIEFKYNITKQFLEHVFHQEVTGFEIRIGTKPGDNYLSLVHSIEVTAKATEDEEEESGYGFEVRKHLFIKSYPDRESTCEFLEKVKLFRTEYFVYSEFLPTLNKLADEIKLSLGTTAETFREEEKIGINSAKFYGGNILGSKLLTTFDKTPWNKENFIILEDLRPKIFRTLGKKEAVCLVHCRLIINQLANIHALSWVHKKRNRLGKLVDKYPFLKDAMYRQDTEEGWKPFMEGISRVCLAVIQREFGAESEIARRFEFLISLNVMELLRKFLRPEGIDEGEAKSLLRVQPEEDSDPEGNEIGEWSVATHGDCSVNNILLQFESKDSYMPVKAVLVDYQTTRESDLTTDLAYFLYCCVRPSDRKKYTNHLLPLYFEKFGEIVTSSGEELPKGFTYVNLLRKWRTARIYALLMVPQFIAFIFKPSIMDKVRNALSQQQNQEIPLERETCNEIAEELEMESEEEKDFEWKKVLIETVLEEYNDGIL